MRDPITAWVAATCGAISPVPDAVQVHEVVSHADLLAIEIRPDPRNAPYIIGKGGATINAIRGLAIRMLLMRTGHGSLMLHVVSTPANGAARGTLQDGPRKEVMVLMNDETKEPGAADDAAGGAATEEKAPPAGTSAQETEEKQPADVQVP